MTTLKSFGQKNTHVEKQLCNPSAQIEVFISQTAMGFTLIEFKKSLDYFICLTKMYVAF